MDKERRTASAYHDVRTEVVTIEARLKRIMQSEDLAHTLHKDVKMALSAAVRCIRRIDEDAADSRSGSSSARDDAPQVNALLAVRNIIAENETYYQAKPLNVTVFAGAGVDHLNVNASVFCSAFLNVFVNAAKYTDSGQITVYVGRSNTNRTTDTATRIVVAVTDSGCGFDDKTLGKLFKIKNASVNASRSRSPKGLQIGMGLVHANVISVGGSMTACNNQGSPGATVEFDLPATYTSEREKTTSSNVVLTIVSSSPTTKRLIQQQVENTYQFRTVDSLEKLDALDAAFDQSVTDLVVVDVDRASVPPVSVSGLVKAMHPNAVVIALTSTVGNTIAAERCMANWGFAATLETDDLLTMLDATIEKTLRLSRDYGSYEPALEAIPVWGATEALSGLTALVVEDNESNRDLCVAMLERAGCRVKVRTTGTAGLSALLHSDGIDFALLDFHLPNMNGDELTARRREKEREEGLPELPIFLMTAEALDEIRPLFGPLSRVNQYFRKPVAPEQLAAAVATALSLPPPATVSAVGGAKEPPTEQPRTALDNKSLRSLEVDLAAIEAGIETGDEDAVFAAAHHMKSTAAFVEAAALLAILDKSSYRAKVPADSAEWVKGLHAAIAELGR